jgi:hypothetical protein
MNTIVSFITIALLAIATAFVIGYLDGTQAPDVSLIFSWYIDGGKLHLGPAVMTA